MLNNNYQICLCGARGAGKTTYINRLLTGEFEPKYAPTQGTLLRQIIFHTNYGPVSFWVSDMGRERFSGLDELGLAQSDAAIIMYGVDGEMSSRAALRYQKLARRAGVEHVLLVANNTSVPQGDGGPAVRISVRTGDNLQEPFLRLARSLTGKEDLVFTE